MAGTKTESTRRRRGKHSGSALISRRLPARSASVHRGTGHSLFRVKSGAVRTECFKGAGLQTPLHLCRGGRGCVLWDCLQTLRCLCWGDRNCLLHGVGLALARGVGQLNGRRNQAFYRLAVPIGRLGALEKYQTFPHIQSHQISA